MIEISDLSVSFGKRKVLKNISYKFEDTGFYTIIGHSGSGKTTFIGCIGGISRPTSGEILYDGNDICKFNKNELRENICGNVSFIFQDLNLIEELSIRDNLMLGVIPEEKTFDEIINKLNLDMVIDCKVNTLSGGEKQRAAIARGIIRQSKVIIVDEPTGNLDGDNAKIIFEYLKELSKTKLVIMVTHDSINAEQFSDKIIKIVSGSIEIVRDSEIISMFPTVDNNVITVEYLSFHQMIKLIFSSIYKNKIILGLMTLLIGISASLIMISGTFSYLNSGDTAYRIMRDYNEDKNVFAVNKTVSYNTRFLYITETIKNGKEIIEDFSDYNIGRGYIDDEMVYLLVEDYTLISLDSGRYPKTENEVIVSKTLYDKLESNSIIFNSKEYFVSGFSSLIDGKYDDIIISINHPEYLQSFFTKFPTSIDTECYYYNEDIYEGCENLSGNKIVVSSAALSYFNLKVGNKYTTKDLSDDKYHGVFNGCLKPSVFLGEEIEVVDSINSSEFFVIVGKDIYNKMQNYYMEFLSYDQLFILGELSRKSITTIYNHGYGINDRYVNALSSCENFISNTIFITIPVLIIAVVILFISVLILIKTLVQRTIRQIGVIKCLGIKFRYILFQLLMIVLCAVFIITIISASIYSFEIYLLNKGVFVLENYPDFSYLVFDRTMFFLPLIIIFFLLFGIISLYTSRLYGKEIKKLLS